MATALDSRSMANPVGYTDLRTLIDIDPPQFDYHKPLVSREALINFSVHAVAKYMNHSTYLEVFMDLKDRQKGICTVFF